MGHPPRYLPGLNGLRFIAASFVVLSHAAQSLVKLGVLDDIPAVLFDRGAEAVELFFTLSGFLITYLLLIEIDRTRTVNIGFFYWRRVLRIWPLYLGCLAVGLLVMKVAIPRLTSDTHFDFPLLTVLGLSVAFLPNVASSFYAVGLLTPLWSIGIEEQFYLVWAPLFKVLRRHALVLILSAVALTCGYYVGVRRLWTTPDDPGWQHLLHNLKYHCMAIGALFAYVLHRHLPWWNGAGLSSPAVQLAAWGFVGVHFLIGIPFVPQDCLSVTASCVYGGLFIHVSSIGRPLINLERAPLRYLGEISYGIYMFHMYADYALRFAFSRWQPTWPAAAVSTLYIGLLALLTVAVASVSFRFIEKPIMSLRNFPLASPRPPAIETTVAGTIAASRAPKSQQRAA